MHKNKKNYPTNKMKHTAAKAALEFLPQNIILGIGTGSTIKYFIKELAAVKGTIKGAVASSIATEEALKSHGIKIYDLNSIDNLPIYIDGADEINAKLEMIKGGGGALTREKIIATFAKQFICIADQTKKVLTLGTFPLPIEVIPMAKNYVARELSKLGGKSVYRKKFITDNQNIILDVHNLQITNPAKLEKMLNDIPGVVTNGIFANRPADILVLGTQEGTQIIHSSNK